MGVPKGATIFALRNFEAIADRNAEELLARIPWTKSKGACS